MDSKEDDSDSDISFEYLWIVAYQKNKTRQDLGPRTLEQYPSPWTLDPAAPRTLDLPAGPRTPNSWTETAIDNLFDLFCGNNFEINFYKYYLFCICFSMILLIQFKLMRRLLKGNILFDVLKKLRLEKSLE